MNQFLLSVFFLTFLSVTEISSINAQGVKPIDTVKVVNAIKVQYAAIDSKRKTYSQYMPDPLGKHKEGVLLIGYYEGQVMKMLNANYYGDSGKTESDHYINETGVILIFSKVYEYISPLSIDRKGTIKSITENWYYFYNEEMIKYVSGGKVIPGGAEEFRKKKEAFKEDFIKTRKLFSNFPSLRKIK